MTLPQKVQDARSLVRGLVRVNPRGIIVRDAWEILDYELHRLTEIAESVDPLVIQLHDVTTKLEAANAEIERLGSAWHVKTLNEKDRLIAAQEAENDRVKSRLAAANALLPECAAIIRELCACYGHPLPDATLDRIKSTLQGAGDEA